MPYVTSIEQIGYDRGLKVGEEKARSLVLRLLNRKLGSIPNPIIDRIHPLSIAQLESLGEALLDFATMDDLITWLDEH